MSIFIVTAVYLSEDRDKRPDDHRVWFWASTFERALDAVKKGPDFWMEAGTYTHVVIEEFEEFHFCEKDMRWFRVKFNPEEGTYDAPEAIENPRPGLCGWGLG